VLPRSWSAGCLNLCSVFDFSFGQHALDKPAEG
jgi:hypothetical protein